MMGWVRGSLCPSLTVGLRRFAGEGEITVEVRSSLPLREFNADVASGL